MVKSFIKIFLVINIVTVKCLNLNPYERNVKFFVFNNITDESYISTFDKNLTEFNCEPHGKFAFVTHGWEESINTGWVMDTIRKLKFYRGGCVIFMDYSTYSMISDYFRLTSHFNRLSHLFARKIRHATSDYKNVFMYGFSFGARLCLEAGAKIGYQLIDHIQVCDPAGPGFDNSLSTIDPKIAAKYVYCINTSVDRGTDKYNCHINFRMGICGRKQIGATIKPFKSHGLCPYFFNSAFENIFVPSNRYHCDSTRKAINIPADFRMGYMETRRSNLYYGDVFIPTSLNYPWNVVETTVL